MPPDRSLLSPPRSRFNLQRSLLLSCEHATNHVPTPLTGLFANHPEVLKTHRAWDPGALELARFLASQLRAPLIQGRLSRLIIELNRSLHHPRLWSEFSRNLSLADRRRLIQGVYEPYRSEVRASLQEQISRGLRVLHVGVHTFTPCLEGRIREVEVGLLYDPARAEEKALALAWQKALIQVIPSLRIRRNYPYRGKADGLTTALRREFKSGVYCGLELEVSQAFPLGSRPAWRRLQQALTCSLATVLSAFCKSNCDL